MQDSTTGLIQKFWKNNLNTNNDDEKLRSYAAVQLLRQYLVQNPSWKYPHAAWNRQQDYIHRKINGTIFNKEKFEDYKSFNSFYTAIAELDIQIFFQLYLPEYIAQPSKAFAALRGLRINDFFQCAMAIHYAKVSFRAKNQVAVPQFLARRNEQDLRPLIDAVNRYSFNYKRCTHTHAKHVVDLLHKHKLGQPDFMTHLYLEYQASHYTTIGVELWKHQKAAGKYAYDARMEMQRVYRLLGASDAVQAVNSLFAEIEHPTEFLESALVSAKNDDSLIECDFIFSKFVEQQSFDPEDRVLIVNPSPSFISEYSKTNLMGQTTFVMEHEPVAEALGYQFPAGKFYTRDVLLNVGGSEFQKILFFSREMSPKELCNTLTNIHFLSASNVSIYAALPTDLLTWTDPEESPLAPFGIRRIDLLPANTFNSEPKKKALIQARLSKTTSTLVARYAFPEKDTTHLDFIEQANIPHKSLCCQCTIFDVLRKAVRPKPTQTRRTPISYAYTPDITFWYTQRQSNTIEAYVCSLPTPKQIKRKLLVRGKKINESVVYNSKLKTPEEIDHWLRNTLPFNAKFHKCVQSSFKKVNADTLCFKSLWYLQLDAANAKTSPTFDDELALVDSEIGTIRYGNQEDFLAAMNAFCEDLNHTDQLKYWQIVRSICRNIAKKTGIVIRGNIAEQPVQELRKKDDGNIADVRYALAKRAFSLVEELALLNYLDNKVVAEPENLGVLIRFYTGLAPNIVCALTWKDFRKITYLDCYQLCISKQYQNDSQEPIPFQDAEEYRCVPICTALVNKLLQRKKQVETLDIPNKLDACQIIATDDQLTGKSNSQITPRRLHKLSKAALSIFETDEMLIELPTNRRGTVETNLANVARDIFRSNFESRTNLTCGFTDAELRYVLGLAQRTPYAKNYCDYTNPLVQFAIRTKLERWETLHTAKNQGIRIAEDQQQSTISFETTKQYASLVLDAEVTSPTTVEINSQYGMDVHAMLTPKKGEQA